MSTQIVWTREHLLMHPSNGTNVYGMVPELKFKSGPPFPAGPIFLKYGQHLGPGRGFGFQHIWRGHCPEITVHADAMKHVCEMVADALRPGTALHYERDDRLQAFSLRAGEVVLQLFRNDDPEIYSIITAGYKPRNAKGPRVGALKRVEP